MKRFRVRFSEPSHNKKGPRYTEKAHFVALWDDLLVTALFLRDSGYETKLFYATGDRS